MHHSGLLQHSKDATNNAKEFMEDHKSLEALLNEVSCIRKKQDAIKEWPISEETKAAVLKDLDSSANEIKERIHDAIDKM